MTKGLRWTPLALALVSALTHAATADRVATMTYNAAGLVETVDGPRTDVADITRYTYNAQGRLATATDALGHVTSYDAYDLYGHPGKVTDANGIVTLMTYTPEGWLATTTRDANGTPSVTTLTYDAVGNIIQTTDADGMTLKYTFDDASRLTDITDGQGNRVHYTLDAAGNRTKEETFDASGTVRRSLSRTFNSLSQLLTVTDALNRTVLSFDTTDGYDTEGHPVHSADARGVQRKQGYDALNRLVSTIEDYNGANPATANTTSVSSHDASDNVTGISDPDGLNTLYDHNGLGDLTGIHSPDTGTTTFTVDAAGNRLTQTDAKGITTTYAYDALNRRTLAGYADTSLNVSYHYDEANTVTGCAASAPIGRLTRIVEQAVTTTYCYDARGNVIQKRQTQGDATDTVAYSYTLADRIHTETRPSGAVVTYSYDTLGQIAGLTVTPPGGTTQAVVSNATYLPFGPIQSYTLGNGQTVSRTYDANYRITDIVSPALELHFIRDVMGNITGVSEAGTGSESYRYDPLYRLASVDDPAGQAIEAYTYNKTGDRLSKTGSGLATGTYGYQPGTHWLTSIGTASRTYDANGNTTGNAFAGETWGYGYNDHNRMTVVQRNGQTVGSYVYNSLEQRTSKTADGTTTRFAYDEGSQLLSEATGNAARDYLWIGGIPVGVLDNPGAASLNYVHADALGSPRVVTTGAGAITWRWSYTSNPLGEAKPTSTTGYSLNLRFPGQYRDQESGLNQNVNRDYSPDVGRYIQADPSGLQAGPSMFAYVSNSPLQRVDPLGLDDGYCRIDPSWCGWARPLSQPISASVGFNETVVAAVIGEQLEFGLSLDSSPNICIYSRVCAMPATGLGVFAGVSATASIGPGALSSGTQWNAVFTSEAAHLVLGGYSVDVGQSGYPSAGRGMIGIGEGTFGGMFACRTVYQCAREPAPPNSEARCK